MEPPPGFFFGCLAGGGAGAGAAGGASPIATDSGAGFVCAVSEDPQRSTTIIACIFVIFVIRRRDRIALSSVDLL